MMEGITTSVPNNRIELGILVIGADLIGCDSMG